MALSESAALRNDKRYSLEGLQHRHYAAMAGIIAGLPHALLTPDLVAEAFAKALEANPRFNRDRFLRACGLEISMEQSVNNNMMAISRALRA